ncbi:Target SNARE coiled-coil homology domain-containing protein [Microbotryomycetes sp. JL221]|nr:Target SNARE coiled-coil homology domain-containing protein [Microbotryomycetes sp. JL221]
MSGHPFTFPNRDSSQDEVILSPANETPQSHEQTLARFRASVATLSQTSQQQQRQSNATTTTVTSPQTPIQPPPPMPTISSHPVAASPTPSIVRHHLPSRPLTTPVPVANAISYPVPIDNFAAPRSDSQQTYVAPSSFGPVTNGSRGHAQQDSLGTIDEKYSGVGGGVVMYDDDVSLLSNRGGDVTKGDNRFTLGDYLDHQNKETGSMSSILGAGAGGRRTKTPTGGRQGWDDVQHQDRRKRWLKMLIAVIVVLVIILAVALGVGLTRSKANSDKSRDENQAASGESSSAQRPIPSTTRIVPESTSKTAASSTASQTDAATSPTTTSRPASTAADPEEGQAQTFSTSFAFEDNGATTVVPLTYTIPQSRLTRENGWYQFTQNVALPHATGGGTFTIREKRSGTASEATLNTYKGVGDYEMEKLVSGDGDHDNQQGDTEFDFFKDVSTIRSNLQAVSTKLDHLEHLHSQSLSSTATESSTSSLTRETIDQVTKDVTSSLQLIRSRIERLTHLSSHIDKSTSTLDPLVRHNHLSALSSSMTNQLQRFNTIEKTHRDKIKERVTRQIKIVDPEATDDDIKEALDAGAGVQVFAQAVAGARTTEARRAFADSQQRQTDLVKLEETIGELALLFQQMQQLILDQEHQFTSIENQTGQVEQDMELGVKQTHQAVLTAASTRKKRKICAAVGVVILIVLWVASYIKASSHFADLVRLSIIVIAVQVSGATKGAPTDASAKPASTPPPAPAAEPQPGAWVEGAPQPAPA